MHRFGWRSAKPVGKWLDCHRQEIARHLTRSAASGLLLTCGLWAGSILAEESQHTTLVVVTSEEDTTEVPKCTNLTDEDLTPSWETTPEVSLAHPARVLPVVATNPATQPPADFVPPPVFMSNRRTANRGESAGPVLKLTPRTTPSDEQTPRVAQMLRLQPPNDNDPPPTLPPLASMALLESRSATWRRVSPCACSRALGTSMWMR